MLEEEDINLIMQKEVHFSGNFKEMKDYYSDIKIIESRDDISIDRIQELIDLEEKHGDLKKYLHSADIEKINDSKSLYEELKAIALSKDEENAAIAEMILQADSSEEGEGIHRVVSLGNRVVDKLISILENEDLYDVIFPGQGMAPAKAVEALKLIGDSSAIWPIFLRIGKVNVYLETIFMSYLRLFNGLTKDLIVKILNRDIWTNDHRTAISVAGAIDFNQEISDKAYEILMDPKKCPNDQAMEIYMAILSLGDIDSDINDKKEAIKKASHIKDSVKDAISFM